MKVRNLGIQFAVLVSICAPPSGLASQQGTQPSTWYVSSKSTTSTTHDGKSWNSAWMELDQINWSLIKGGDTIKIDGGTTSNPGYYSKTMRIGASGLPGFPITITSATEPGRNGQVLIYGQVNLGQSTNTGIDLGNNHDIQIVGQPGSYGADKSIKISGFFGEGISQGPASSAIRLKHLDISGNGFDQRTLVRNPNGAGLRLQGAVECDNLTIRQNATQVVISPSSTNYNPFFVRCYIYNDNYVWPSNAVFNTDGVRIEDGPKQGSRSYAFNSCLFGPGLATGIDWRQKNTNVYVSDCLFLNPKVADINRPQATGSNNSLTMRHVVSYLAPLNYENKTHSCISLAVEPGKDSIGNSIFWGGVMDIRGSGITTYPGARNFQFKTSGNTVEVSAAQSDPGFVADLNKVDQAITNAPWYSQYYSRITDYTLRSDSPARAAQAGCTITSVQAFITQQLQAP